MPELPEVDTMVSRLRDQGASCGEVIDVRIFRDPGRYSNVSALKGRTLHTIARRGKYMTFHTDKGIGVGHNAMSGFWDVKDSPWTFDYVEGSRTASQKDVRFEIDLLVDREVKTLRYHDTRLFGSFKFFQPCRSIEEIEHLAKLGPEALFTSNVDPTICRQKRQWNILGAAMMLDRKVEIKHALMEQEAVAGIGNIYATEALYYAGIDPSRITKTLTTDEWQKVFEFSQAVLRQALERKLNYAGLMCYRQKFSVCKAPIQKKIIRGRSTYWCPSCQK